MFTQGLTFVSLISAAMSVGLGIAYYLTIRRMGRLYPNDSHADRPKVSVIVPARV